MCCRFIGELRKREKELERVIGEPVVGEAAVVSTESKAGERGQDGGKEALDIWLGRVEEAGQSGLAVMVVQGCREVLQGGFGDKLSRCQC